MAEGFLEDLGTDTPGDANVGSEAAAAPAENTQADTQQPVDGGTEEPTGTEAETKEEVAANDDRSKELELELAKVREEAAYWRGRQEAANGARAQEANQANQPSEDELRQWEDEYLADPRGVTEKMIQEKLGREMQQYRLHYSRDQMRREANDYDEVIAKFQQIASNDPTIEMQLINHADPARFAYEFAKRQMALEQYGGNPDTMAAEMEKKIRAEVETKLRKEMALKDAGDTPKTPAQAKGSGGNASARPQELDPLAGNPFD